MAFVSCFYLLTPDLLLFLYFQGTNDARAAELRSTAVVLMRFVAAYNLFDAIGIIFVGSLKGAGDTRFVLGVTLVMAGLLAGACWWAIERRGAGLQACFWLVTAWGRVGGVVYFARCRPGRCR